MDSNDFSTDTVLLPFLGDFPTGKCLDKRQEKGKISVPNYLNVSKNHFVLKMKGYSMQENGLLHGDLLVIKPCSTTSNNRLVIATIDNLETVIRQFEQTNDLIILSSKKPTVKPMIFDPSRIKILGVVVAQMRAY